MNPWFSSILVKLLAASLYKGNPDRHHKLRDIYIYIYAGAVGMLLHINGKFTMGKLNHQIDLE
jgi:hypothetical protein